MAQTFELSVEQQPEESKNQQIVESDDALLDLAALFGKN